MAQHFTIYGLITIDGLIALQAGIRQRWPRGLLGVWEAGSLALVGFQMQSHFHGACIFIFLNRWSDWLVRSVWRSGVGKGTHTHHTNEAGYTNHPVHSPPGGPMISRMHALMCPSLTLVGALLFTDRVFGPALPSPTREGLRLGACVAMVRMDFTTFFRALTLRLWG